MGERNPFEFGRELGADELVDREEEISLLLRTVENRAKLFLIGPRRFGKSSVMRAAAEELKSARGVALRYNAEAYEQLSLLAEALLGGATRELSTTIEKAGQAVREFFANLSPEITYDPRTDRMGVRLSISPPQEQLPVLTEVLRGIERMAERVDRPVAVMIDEFQHVVQEHGEEAERKLRAVIQEQQHVAYILAGSKMRMLVEMTGNANRPFYRLGTRYFLGPVPRSDFSAFLQERFAASGFELNPGTDGYILDQAQDVPFNVQQLAHYTWELARSSTSRTITRESVDNALGRIVQNDDPLYTQLWTGLTTTQKKALKAVIYHQQEGLFSASVTRKFGMAASSMQSALQVLQNKGFVREEEASGSKQLVLEDPFFAAWLERMQSPDQ